jgi:hypothetical protein
MIPDEMCDKAMQCSIRAIIEKIIGGNQNSNPLIIKSNEICMYPFGCRDRLKRKKY